MQVQGEVLYGYPVLGKVEVADPDKRRAVIAAIKTAVRGQVGGAVEVLHPASRHPSGEGGRDSSSW